jgi:hypothetical protein
MHIYIYIYVYVIYIYVYIYFSVYVIHTHKHTHIYIYIHDILYKKALMCTYRSSHQLQTHIAICAGMLADFVKVREHAHCFRALDAGAYNVRIFSCVLS